MRSHSSQDFSLFLYSHLPDGTGGFVIEADHTVSTEGLYLTFIYKGSICDIHSIRHCPCSLVWEIFIVLYRIGFEIASAISKPYFAGFLRILPEGFWHIFPWYVSKRIGLDSAVFICESDSHGDHGAVLIMLAYDIYKLLIVSFSHDIPLSPAIYCGFIL